MWKSVKGPYPEVHHIIIYDSQKVETILKSSNGQWLSKLWGVVIKVENRTLSYGCFDTMDIFCPQRTNYSIGKLEKKWCI